MNIIETHNLTRRFGRTEAVHDLTFALPAGSVCALLGANGAGKSTTIKLLMNLLTPAAGTARVLGVEARKLGEQERAQIGYVAENQQLPLWMTVRQLMDYCRPFYPTWDRALEKSLLAQFALPEDRKLKHLSRGMLMKAALLSSLAYRPKLLVLDEPFSGLDPLVREEFVAGMLEISASGDWTVLISSHDIDEVERLCDRVALLDHGRLQLAESTEALQARFRRIELTLAKSVAEIAPPLPASWLSFEQAGGLVRFIETRYDRATTEQVCRERFGTAGIAAQPMSLREIFLILARANQREGKGAAA